MISRRPGPLHAVPITKDDGPPGSEPLSLISERAGAYDVRGRVVADGLPCTVGDAGCGGETMAIVRMPLFGLNLPGEPIVGTIGHCSVCGPGPDPSSPLPRLVTPTEQELAWGWAPGTVG